MTRAARASSGARRAAVALAGLALSAAGCAGPAPAASPCPTPRRGHEVARASLDYVDFVRVDGRTYLALDRDLTRPVPAGDLGEQVGAVRCMLSGRNDDRSYVPRDGDAAYLAAGAALHAVPGYAPGFRIAAQAPGGESRIYEVDDDPRARRAEDLLDVRGKVRAIREVDTDDGRRVLASIQDPKALTTLVDGLLDAPVRTDEEPQRDDERRFLVLELADGTSVRRPWWPRQRLVGRGIVLPEGTNAALLAALEQRA